MRIAMRRCESCGYFRGHDPSCPRYEPAPATSADQVAALFEKVATLEAENERLREQVARDEGDAATMRGFIATHGCTPSMMYSRAVVAERQLAEARHANRTRPDYDLRCQECGRAHILDTSLPSDVWNQIADPADVLCTTCIDGRLNAKGLTAEAEFYFVGAALQSKLYAESHGEIAYLKRELAEARWALEWYQERAEALASDKAKNPDYAVAVVTELSLDAGNRARAALPQEPASDSGDNDAWAYFNRER